MMPKENGTGPCGCGPMTGRGCGPCGGSGCPCCGSHRPSCRRVLTKQEEKESLEEEAKILEKELAAIKERVAEL